VFVYEDGDGAGQPVTSQKLGRGWKVGKGLIRTLIGHMQKRSAEIIYIGTVGISKVLRKQIRSGVYPLLASMQYNI